MFVSVYIIFNLFFFCLGNLNELIEPVILVARKVRVETIMLNFLHCRFMSL